MGSGIAQLCAQSGFPTILYDLDQAILDKARIAIEKNLQLSVEKGRITPAKKIESISLIKFSGQISDCKADLVIEAIIEKEEVKSSLFNQLEKINESRTILATNTSSLSVTTIAESVKSKANVAGLHFFNPAPLMRLVEVVKTKYNSQSTIDLLVSFATRLGKTAVVCRDSPGFIVNHVARPYYIESLHLASLGHADFATIDELMEASGFKMGPFRLMDLIGNDVNYAVSCSVYEAMGKPERLKPSPIQKEKVEKGQFGRKSGVGYYRY
jgi:3-hydroxybutyryl-CoA dehydrogenase